MSQKLSLTKFKKFKNPVILISHKHGNMLVFCKPLYDAKHVYKRESMKDCFVFCTLACQLLNLSRSLRSS